MPELQIKKQSKDSDTSFKLLQLGADVEMFLKDRHTGLPVPCVGVVGGTKDSPLALPNLPAGFARQEDNVMLEFNVPPSATADVWVSNMGTALGSIKSLLDPKGLEFVIVPSMRFDPKDLMSEQAQHIGCDTDYNVWKRCANDVTEFPEECKNLRTSGGHVHISFLVNGKIPEFPADLEHIENVVMALDIFLGIPLLLQEPDNERRNLYGKAGAFRPKPYGVEYRVLSNHWISTPDLTRQVFNQVVQCFSFLDRWQGDGLNNALRGYTGMVEEAINKRNARYAQELLHTFSVKVG